MSRKKRQTKLFSIVITMLMVFSLIIPGTALAESAEKNNKPHEEFKNAEDNVVQKVSKRLQKQFKDNDKVTFLVKFKDKADVKKVAQEARENAEIENLTSQKTEFVQRSSIISELKSTAMESQQKVMDFLNQQEKNGNAEDIRPYYIVNGIAVTAKKGVAKKIASFPEVEKLLPNEKRELIKAVDTNAKVPAKETAEVEWNVGRVGAPAVWDMGIDGEGTVVASIDTGTDWEHAALKDKYRGYDPETGEVDHTHSFFDPVNGEKEPYDNNGHGTHVTGTMVGSEADSSNQVGVAPGAQWISVQAFTPSGAYDTDLLAAAEWILAPGGDVTKAPDVVNNSWGGGPGLDEWYRDAVTAWRAADIFPTFAAGNTSLTNPGGPGSVAVPANYPESYAVGATDINDNLAEFSLRGPSPYDEIKPDISAPGVNIESSIPGDEYGLKSGTSMASPAVSGIVALIRQADAGLSVGDIENILMDTATPKTNDEYQESPNNGYGHGLVNAFEAVSFIMDGLGTIEGAVTKDGEDHENPTYEYSAPKEVYTGMDTTLNIQARDNVSVTSIELEYQMNEGNWKTIEASLVSGDYTNGEYEVVIDGDELEEGHLTYKWTINDYGNNKITSEEYEVPVASGISLGYFEDFEEEPAGWTSFGKGNDWEWGKPTSGPDNAASGENVYGTNLDGSYTNGANATLVMPAVDLPEEESYLQFDLWYDLEEVHDIGYVYVSTDQEEWNTEKIVFYDSDGWESMEIDLSEYSGQRVYIGFNITSKTPNDVTKPGKYLDNVGLSAESNESSISNRLQVQKNVQRSKINMEKIKQNEPLNRKMQKKEEKIQPAALPMEAEVSILETSRTTRTNPVDGTYTLTSLAAGEYTLQADAYGFYPDQQTTTVENEATTVQNFMLEEIPKGTISGQITDETTGESIEDATLFLMEDANITPVETDENGRYNLKAYEGTYTLKAIAQGYHYKEMEVTIDEDGMELNIELEPYYSYKYEEIGYDDGSGEIPRTFYGEGNMAAVKISLPDDQEKALVTDGVFKFHDDRYPRPGPGSTEFAVEVWDASGENGMPGKKLAGPIEAEAIRDIDQWTTIDLTDENIIVDGDFYMVYVQTKADRYAPALASDADDPYAGRSYEHINGFWNQSREIEGNYMIRARVAYEVGTPTITTPSDDQLTRDPEVTIEGSGSPGTAVKLLNNGSEMGRSDIDDKGNFSIDIELNEGENELSVIALVDGKETKESEPVIVTLDTTSPELTIDNPQDGDKTNRETVTVEGTVDDANLDTVEVNGRETNVADDGSYSQRILLDNGENGIEVAAEDLAGNTATKSVTIHVDFVAPTIENLLPTEDKNLEAGESVRIESDSEPGQDATFVIHMPLTNTGAQLSNATELPMMEMSDGHYVGYWTATNNMVAEGAVIEVKVVDEFGNEIRQTAEGKLFINKPEE